MTKAKRRGSDLADVDTPVLVQMLLDLAEQIAVQERQLNELRRRRVLVFVELRNRGWDMTRIGKAAGMTRQAVANLLASVEDE